MWHYSAVAVYGSVDATIFFGSGFCSVMKIKAGERRRAYIIAQELCRFSIFTASLERVDFSLS